MSKKPVALIVGAAAITKAITSIATRGAKLDGDIQLAGLSVLSHIAQHGDVTLADKLVQAMPKGARKLALVEWMLAFGQVRVLDKANAEDKAKIADGATLGFAKDKATDIASATEKPWHEFRKEKPVADAFDAQAAVLRVMAQFKRAGENGLTVENRTEALTEARALVALLEGGAE